VGNQSFALIKLSGVRFGGNKMEYVNHNRSCPCGSYETCRGRTLWPVENQESVLDQPANVDTLKSPLPGTLVVERLFTLWFALEHLLRRIT
jgi:hypothetical protein